MGNFMVATDMAALVTPVPPSPAFPTPPQNPEGLDCSIKGWGSLSVHHQNDFWKKKNTSVSIHEHNKNACGVMPSKLDPVNCVN